MGRYLPNSMKCHTSPKFATALLVGLSLLASAAPVSAATNHTTVHLQVDVDQPVLLAGSTQHAVVKVSLDGLRPPATTPHEPVNLALVLDRSGSMRGEKLEQAKTAALEAVRRLRPDDIFSLVIFDSDVQTLVPARRVGDRVAIEQAILSIRAGGMTAIYGGVTQGVAQLRKHSEDPRFTSRLFLLSDGLANVGPSTPVEFAGLGTALGQEGISVSTVGVGLDYNEDLMTRLARRSDGNTYFAATSHDLPAIFNAELGDALDVVARRVVVTIDFPEQVRPISFIGRGGNIQGQRAEFSLNQIYGGQSKFALIEVEVAPGTAGQEYNLAEAHIVFEKIGSTQIASATANRVVRFSAAERDVIAAANRQIQVDYAANVTALAKDKAIALVDDNQRAEAARQWRVRNDMLRNIGNTYSNSAVLDLVNSNAVEADRIEKEGLSKALRKTYRTDNAQTTAQQSSSWSSSSRP